MRHRTVRQSILTVDFGSLTSVLQSIVVGRHTTSGDNHIAAMGRRV